MAVLFGLFLFFLFLYWFCCKVENHSIKCSTEQFEKDGFKYVSRHFTRYLGGLKSHPSNKECLVYILDKKIQLYFRELGKDKNIDIFPQDIVNCEILTKTQIQERVSLGKLAVFGVLSFAMSGTKRVDSDDFVVITAKVNNEVRNIILKATVYENDNYRIVEHINSMMIKS